MVASDYVYWNAFSRPYDIRRTRLVHFTMHVDRFMRAVLVAKPFDLKRSRRESYPDGVVSIAW